MGVTVVAVLTALGAAAVSAAAPSSVTVGVGSSTTLGQVLTGPNGHTLYTLSSDSTNSSTCSGQCAVAWPPLEVASGGSVTGPSGMSGKFSTFSRSDGTTQVSFNGQPLYYFIQDTAAGQTNGEGVVAFGGTWHVVKASAAGASAAASASASGSANASASPSGSSAVAGATATTAAGSLPPTSTDASGSGSGPSPMLPIVLLIGGLAALAAFAVLRSRTTQR